MLGACAAGLVLLPDLAEFRTEAGGLDRAAVLMAGIYLLGFIVPIGALVGGVGGLLVSPLALLFGQREDLLQVIARTAALSLPATWIFSLAEAIPVSALGVGLTAVGLFVAQVLFTRRLPQVVGVAVVVALGPILLAPTLRHRHFLPDDVPSILEVMQTNDATLSHRAGQKLIEVAGQEGLLTALRHSDSRVRCEAARQIQAFPSERARVALEQVLAEALEEGDQPLVFITRHALETINR